MSGATTRVVVVTGLSGAGKSTAIAALEDLGFHAVENLPPSVIEHAIVACEQAGVHNIALSFAADVGAFLEGAADELALLARGERRRVTVVFLDASDEVLVRRFSETRRPHPLAFRQPAPGEDSAHQLIDGVRLERARLAPLRALSEVVLDTSGMRVHDLRKRILRTFQVTGASGLAMQVRVQSFGFKFGLPSDADLVFDVRFLDNPYFVPELRPLTGLDQAVSDYVMSREHTDGFMTRTLELLSFLLPRYEAEGKSYLTIAIGCTGGQHRSVAIAKAIHTTLLDKDLAAVLLHRDAPIPRPPEDTPAPPRVREVLGGNIRGGGGA